MCRFAREVCGVGVSYSFLLHCVKMATSLALALLYTREPHIQLLMIYLGLKAHWHGK